ncbi:SLC13 family permease [Caldicellulosiruptoraceae bacterium PP1]
MQSYVLASVIFVIIYIFIATEKVNKAAIAIFGAVLMIALGIVSQEKAIEEYIDFNTIFFLIGMMIVVGILKESGLFEYLAVKSAKISKGNPIVIMVLLSIITAFFSAFLDNVTTVLLITPVMIYIARKLNINPIPLAITVIFASNIGGTATMIGDPPNILIGSQVKLDFIEFANNLSLISIFILIVTIFIFSLIYKNDLKKSKSNSQLLEGLSEDNLIKDNKLLIKSLFVLFIAILGFIFHSQIHLESATIALFAAALLMILSGFEPVKIFKEVEWETIFFFIGLFVMVGALEETGVIKMLAEKLLSITNGNEIVTAISILWLAAIASAFLDNIPFTATMIPLIKITGEISGMDIYPFWWALALGACLGGNGTSIGASANVVTIGMLKEEGINISFGKYLKIGFPVMLISIIISTIYIVLRYY